MMAGQDLQQRANGTNAQRFVTAWVTGWAAFSHTMLKQIPFRAQAQLDPLMRHLPEVTRGGQALVPVAAPD
jgi:hypothetical protein